MNTLPLYVHIKTQSVHDPVRCPIRLNKLKQK
jgi:hypothetical protein